MDKMLLSLASWTLIGTTTCGLAISLRGSRVDELRCRADRGGCRAIEEDGRSSLPWLQPTDLGAGHEMGGQCVSVSALWGSLIGVQLLCQHPELPFIVAGKVVNQLA